MHIIMKRFILFLTILVLVSTISCKKDFLDVPDKTVLVRQAYVTDLKTLGDYLNGVYIELSTQFYTGNTHIYGDLIADNIKSNSNNYLGTPYAWAQAADEDGSSVFGPRSVNANGIWSSGYKLARDCNFVIEEVDKYRSENPAKADAYKGQAYALRAFAHFLMVNVFAQSYNFSPGATHPGIPYITNSDYRIKVNRLTVAEVYDRVIEDFKNAIQLLPAGVIDSRYMNLAASKALLARTYLFKEDYQSAKNLAREIASQYPLLTKANDYPFGLFKQLPVTKSESLFQLVPADPAVPTSGGNYPTTFAGLYYKNLNLLWASSDIGKILTENMQDARSAWVTKAGADYNVTKYPVDVIPGFALSTLSYYETLVRSSEMFLTAAESYAKLNNEDSARFYLNGIRLRANPSAIAVSASGTALMDSIQKERRKELAFEGLRMFDMQRWKKSIDRTDPGFPTAKTLTYPNNKAIAPIPGHDVRLAGLPQNPGY
jgi:starch-binding outer membrane protein, SusD/RagB family